MYLMIRNLQSNHASYVMSSCLSAMDTLSTVVQLVQDMQQGYVSLTLGGL